MSLKKILISLRENDQKDDQVINEPDEHDDTNHNNSNIDFSNTSDPWWEHPSHRASFQAEQIKNIKNIVDSASNGEDITQHPLYNPDLLFKKRLSFVSKPHEFSIIKDKPTSIYHVPSGKDVTMDYKNNPKAFNPSELTELETRWDSVLHKDVSLDILKKPKSFEKSHVEELIKASGSLGDRMHPNVVKSLFNHANDKLLSNDISEEEDVSSMSDMATRYTGGQIDKILSANKEIFKDKNVFYDPNKEEDIRSQALQDEIDAKFKKIVNGHYLTQSTALRVLGLLVDKGAPSKLAMKNLNRLLIGDDAEEHIRAKNAVVPSAELDHIASTANNKIINTLLASDKEDQASTAIRIYMLSTLGAQGKLDKEHIDAAFNTGSKLKQHFPDVVVAMRNMLESPNAPKSKIAELVNHMHNLSTDKDVVNTVHDKHIGDLKSFLLLHRDVNPEIKKKIVNTEFTKENYDNNKITPNLDSSLNILARSDNTDPYILHQLSKLGSQIMDIDLLANKKISQNTIRGLYNRYKNEGLSALRKFRDTQPDNIPSDVLEDMLQRYGKDNVSKYLLAHSSIPKGFRDKKIRSMSIDELGRHPNNKISQDFVRSSYKELMRRMHGEHAALNDDPTVTYNMYTAQEMDKYHNAIGNLLATGDVPEDILENYMSHVTGGKDIVNDRKFADKPFVTRALSNYISAVVKADNPKIMSSLLHNISTDNSDIRNIITSGTTNKITSELIKHPAVQSIRDLDSLTDNIRTPHDAHVMTDKLLKNIGDYISGKKTDYDLTSNIDVLTKLIQNNELAPATIKKIFDEGKNEGILDNNHKPESGQGLGFILNTHDANINNNPADIVIKSKKTSGQVLREVFTRAKELLNSHSRQAYYNTGPSPRSRANDLLTNLSKHENTPSDVISDLYDFLMAPNVYRNTYGGDSYINEYLRNIAKNPNTPQYILDDLSSSGFADVVFNRNATKKHIERIVNAKKN